MIERSGAISDHDAKGASVHEMAAAAENVLTRYLSGANVSREELYAVRDGLQVALNEQSKAQESDRGREGAIRRLFRRMRRLSREKPPFPGQPVTPYRPAAKEPSRV